MRVLAYEGRRLLGLRSTWLILATALLADAVVAAVLARQTAPGPLPVRDAVRLLTAAVPLLPVPLAALAAGTLGALACAHEVRHPGLAASQVRYLARLRLLAGKLTVIAVVSALLAAASLALNAVVVRFALPSATAAARLYSPDLLRADQRPVMVLAAFAALVVAGGWTGVLAAALTRSAAAGLLLLCALPMLVAPVAEVLLRQRGAGRVGRLLPFQHGLDHLYGVNRPAGPAGSLASLFEVTEPLAVAALLVPAVVLLAACLLAQAGRRSL